MPPRHANLIFLLAVLAAGLGCQGSRWARSDPKYAAKYPVHTDNVVRMAKQASDARQVEGRTGLYSGVAVRTDPVAVGVQAGGFAYPEGYRGMLETRGSVAGLVVAEDGSITGGVDLGARLQTPTRLAPFVGAGVYAGVTPDFGADEDGIDNDGDGRTDEWLEEREFVAAVYPEIGAHFWITPSWRLTASASHYYTTLDRDSDFTLLGVSLAWLDIPRRHSPQPYRVECADVASPVQKAAIEPADDQPLRLPAIASEHPWPSEPWAPPANPR